MTVFTVGLYFSVKAKTSIGCLQTPQKCKVYVPLLLKCVASNCVLPNSLCELPIFNSVLKGISYFTYMYVVIMIVGSYRDREKNSRKF